MRARGLIPGAHLLAASLCAGFALPLLVRPPRAAAAIVALSLAAAGLAVARAPVWLLAAALVAAGSWWGAGRLDALSRSVLVSRIDSSGLARVEVTGPARRSAFTTRVPVRVTEYDRDGVDEPAQLELPASERAPPQGARLELVVRVDRPREREHGSTFDEEQYLRRRGIHVVLHASSFRIVGRRGGLPGMADRIRAYLASSISPGLTGERAALVAGIVLGEDEGLDAELRDRFRASGLYHLLAVSGQNVAYVVAGVLLAAWLAGIPRSLAQLAALAAIGAYVLAVGWQPSVVRAGVAGGLASLAWLVSRPSDRWYFLLVGAAVLLAWNPYSLLDPGFQLSFAAVGAIFLVAPRLERIFEGYPIPRGLTTVVAVSAACGTVTAPVLWLQFGSIPLLSVIANAMAAPVVAPILGSALAAAAIGLVLPGAARSLAWVDGWLVEYLAWCARSVGGLPFARIASWQALAAVLAVAALAVGLRRAPRAWRKPTVAAAIVAAALGAGWKLWPRATAASPPTGLRISFLDVGQGDSILLQVPEGAVLVDEGPPEADVARQLGRRGVRRLAAMVLTHPERDHIGGAADVLRRVPVREILDPRQRNPSTYESEALAVAAARHVRVVAARAGETFRLGRLTLRVLWPDQPGVAAENPNDYAVVLLASYGQVDALLTADAESNVTASLPLGPVEILKVAHHGSADSGLADLLRRLRPLIAVISVGRDNEYGHPAPSTLAALAAAGPRVFRTDRDGAVVVETDGRRLGVEAGG